MANLSKTSGKLTILLLVLLAISFSALPAQAKYGGGTGEPNDPYLIFDANQMNTIGADSNNWNKHFKLMADVDLSSYTGTSFNIIGYYVSFLDPNNKPFAGVFDGNGHAISNFRYTSTDVNGIGLFGCVSGEVKDLGLKDPNLRASGTAHAVGSLIGELQYRGTITNCYVVAGSVSGNSNVGGLVGGNCGAITNCYSAGTVSGNKSAGGLVGNNTAGTITNCYSTARVSGNYYVGGLVGLNAEAIINCYSTGSVSGNNVRGLVGWNGGVVSNSFWDVETSGQSTSEGGTGKTTAEMQTASTFVGWGCGCVWTIDEGVDYPRLWWENQPGELITNPSYGGGTGDPNNPYLIYTAEQLNWIGLIRCDWDKHFNFKLMADIDLAGFTGTSFNIIGNSTTKFTGVFDGNSHTISNFSSISPGRPDIGLFGFVNGAEIKDLGLVNPNVEGHYWVGSLVGVLNGGTITNCYAEGGSIAAGGGYTGMKNGVGGLVGGNGYGTIANCYATASVSGSERSVGGLVGHNGLFSTIINCYSTGSVSGSERSVGGLVGHNDPFSAIINCYSTGSVSGDYLWLVGGLVGREYQDSGVVSASFWDIETSGQLGSAGGTGKTTAEMQMMSTFMDAGWDFVGERINGSEDIWMMTCEGMSYAKLNWWQPVLGDYFCPDGVDMIDMEHLALHWLDTGCDETNDYCDWAEISNDSTIDFTDFAILAGNWLAGR